MGLDIVAYSHVKSTPPHDVSYETCQEHIRAYVLSPDMSLSFLGLTEDTCYQPTDDSERISFRAGSYSGYGDWRAVLAQIVGQNIADYWQGSVVEKSNLPFFELLNFADNEGTIGPIAARNLLDDFHTWDDKAREQMDEWYYERYVSWTEACNLAKDDGLILFC